MKRREIFLTFYSKALLYTIHIYSIAVSPLSALIIYIYVFCSVLVIILLFSYWQHIPPLSPCEAFIGTERQTLAVLAVGLFCLVEGGTERLGHTQ